MRLNLVKDLNLATAPLSDYRCIDLHIMRIE